MRKIENYWLTCCKGVVSLELLTVFFDGPVALYITYLLSKGSPKANFWMIVLATAELYGGMYPVDSSRTDLTC